MNINLKILMNNTEGALIRTLGTVERRGHRLLGLSSRASGPAIQQLLLEIDCGERSADVLVRQIDRLYDVISVSKDQTRNRTPVDPQLNVIAAGAPSTGHNKPIRSFSHD